MPNTCTRCKQPGHNTRTCSNPPAPRITRGRGGQPGNTNALRHGFYTDRFKYHDLQSLNLIHDHIDRSSETNTLRVAINRLATAVHDQLTFKETIAMVHAVTRATGRIGHLVKVQKLIEADSNSVSALLYAALEDVAEEFDLYE